MRRKLVTILAFFALIGGVVFWFLRSDRGDAEPRTVNTTGIVQGLETNVASKIAGRIRAISVREGDRARAGEPLVELESTELAAVARQARSALQVAQATLAAGRDAVESAQAQVEAARAEAENDRAAMARAEARLDQTRKDLDRARELFRGGIYPRASLEAAETEHATREADLASAQAALSAALSRAEAAAKARKKAQADVATLEARINEARDEAAVAEARLGETRILAPSGGLVEYRAMEPGEVVAPGASILTLVDVDQLWVRIDLEQRFAAAVRRGQRATIRLEGVPGKEFSGEVWDVGREGEFATERDVTRGRQDIRTFRTRIRVADGGGVLKPGMTARVEIPLAEQPR